MNNEVGVNIRRARQEKDYTQEYVAFKIGIGQNTYSKYETGQTRITVDVLCKVATVLNVSPSILLGETDLAIQQEQQHHPYVEKLTDQLVASKNAEIDTLKIANQELTKVIQSLEAIVNSIART